MQFIKFSGLHRICNVLSRLDSLLDVVKIRIWIPFLARESIWVDLSIEGIWIFNFKTISPTMRLYPKKQCRYLERGGPRRFRIRDVMRSTVQNLCLVFFGIETFYKLYLEKGLRITKITHFHPSTRPFRKLDVCENSLVHTYNRAYTRIVLHRVVFQRDFIHFIWKEDGSSLNCLV